MNTWVKICGITTAGDALASARAGANAIGFIFYRKSPRYISPDDAATIVADIPSSVVPYGVFVNETRDGIRRIISISGIRGIQLSGDETPADCAGYGLPVIKAFRIRDPRRTEEVKSFEIDAALLDGADNESYGGTGRLASPEIALCIKQYHPLILSGGIRPEIVASLIRNIQPYGVDVSSGVESSPGRKDHSLIRNLFRQIAPAVV
jgi:phosphoribosylanthranilate isomerase